MKYPFLLFVGLLLSSVAVAQTYSKADTLRGSITAERAWWDLQHYELEVTVDPKKRFITGKNRMSYRVIDQGNRLQIDLQSPMKITKILQQGKSLSFSSEGTAHFVAVGEQEKGSLQELEIYFEGKPRVARNAPWDGGFSWSEDSQNKPFIATSNQGIGASVWWPNKDHPADEPDRGIDLHITAPVGLTAVGNGRLIKVSEKKNQKTWHWKVVNPINNYGVNINIGDYVNFSEKYQGIDGVLDLDYWVLKENLEKAKEQFKQVPMMMQAFEHWFGPYPFYEDSFKLVEVPYLGMEHQSSVTYGNKYLNGYLGTDLSGSGWGMKFDFIIIHEAGHEWFANNITNSDVADMWLHEGFTAYSENLYLDYHFGKVASSDYVIGTRKNIQNTHPIIADYGVNQSGGIDMYYKGANILHTLRQLLEDDEKWRAVLMGLNTEFRHQTVSSAEVEQYISEKTGIDLTEFWQQYLRTAEVPVIEYFIENDQLHYRYTNVIEKFDMPVIMLVNEKEHWIYPKATWNTKGFETPINKAHIKRDFFVMGKMVK